MSALPIRVADADLEVLERRAAELAAPHAAEDGAAAGLLRLVAFRVRGRPCAVDAGVVERAVAALAAPVGIPLAGGTERPVVFVDERPVPVVDLAGAAAGATRDARGVAGAPALVVSTAGGPVAVAVEGPLDLAEDRLAETATDEAPGAPPRIVGRLAGGASLVDAAWLAAWAGEAARP